METAEQLKKKIGSAEDLRDLVRTMKLLAVTNIRRFQEAVEALADYYHTIEMGLQIALQREALNTALGAGGWRDIDHPQGDLGLVVLGTDQGLCGRYNEVVVDFSREVVEEEFQGERPRSILCVGLRPALQLEHLWHAVEVTFPVPGFPTGVTRVVQEIVLHIETWQSLRGITRVVLIHNELVRGVYYKPAQHRLLPLDKDWFLRYTSEPWPNRRVIPTFTMDPAVLLASLVRQHLFFSVYRAQVEALASENAARFLSMQTAEKNIEDRLEELRMTANQQRQNSITEELLDIVAGYEALGGSKMTKV